MRSRECLIVIALRPLSALFPSFKKAFTTLSHRPFLHFVVLFFLNLPHLKHIPPLQDKISKLRCLSFLQSSHLSFFLSMTPPYHNSPPSPFPLELNQDQHHQLLVSATPQVSSSSSSFSNSIFFNPAQDQGGCYYMELNHFQNDQEVINICMISCL